MGAVQTILAALEHTGGKVITNGTGHKAQCPAHDDRNPSLSVRGIEGQALLHCHAGCDWRDVLDALALTPADLFDDQAGARYGYDDGRIVHRTPAKAFRQSGNTHGDAQLYRRSRVDDAVKAGQTVYLVEGEKDVHALEAIGAVATTAPMGATNWTKVDPSPLAGAHLAVVPDRDPAGEKWLHDVLDSVDGKAASVSVFTPKTGKDAADHVAAGHGLNDLTPIPTPTEVSTRQVRLTPASTIKPRPVRWLWADRLPAGEVCLTPGRGGVGKSTFHAWVIAHLTRGTLPGVHQGEPRACIIAAVEDSWQRTIVPRLIAAGADLELAYRADVVTDEGAELSLTLPADCDALAGEVDRVGAVLLSLDPLMSTINGSLDTHKDRDVRQALEPLARLADQAGITVLGNAHFNKSSGSDPMNAIMGSAAFGNVVRAALGFAADTDTDDGGCVISQVKNNLGKLDLPSLRYRIDAAVLPTDEGPAEVGRLVMLGESDRSVADIMRDRGDQGDRSERDEAAAWLVDYLAEQGGQAKAGETIKAAAGHGIAKTTLTRARERAGVISMKDGMSGGWVWSLGPRRIHEGTEETSSETVDSSVPSVDSSGDLDVPQGICQVCREPLDPVLAGLGDTTHPGCTPERTAA
ncbi:MAG: AAA family ATPase [Streptosporangiales bacterium]|nr:AAA family ATPase [Streptosporangiales bacterium]